MAHRITRQQWLWIPGWGMDRAHWGSFPQRWESIQHQYVDFSCCSNPEQFSDIVRQSLGHVDQVIAWSLGAMVALSVLTESSWRMVPLVVLSGSLRFIDEQRTNEAGWMKYMQGVADHPQQTMRHFYEQVWGKRGTVPACTWRSESLHAGLAYLGRHDVRHKWAMRSAHTLWLHGSLDRVCGAEGVPDEAMWIARAGHAPFWSHPEACQEAIQQWMER